MLKTGTVLGLGILVLGAAAVRAQAPDPRTAAGQLAVCGGAAKWRAVGYLEFEVKTKTSSGAVQGPVHYHWDRRNGYLRVQGPNLTGAKIDTAIDLGSRSGGAWEDGQQLTGKKLADAVNWALTRFGQDVLWLTFPLDWGAAGVTVKALPDTPADGGMVYPTAEVTSATGTWTVMLDPPTGRIARTVLNRKGAAPFTAGWEDWQAVGGVYFARLHPIGELGESVEVSVSQALPEPPKGAF